MKQDEKLREAFSGAAAEETERLEQSLSLKEYRKAEALYQHHRDAALRQIRRRKSSFLKGLAGLAAVAAAVVLLFRALDRPVPDPVTPAAGPAGTAVAFDTLAPRPPETEAVLSQAPVSPAASPTGTVTEAVTPSVTAPEDAPVPELKARVVAFPKDQRYAVYTGPGQHYERANQNRALVSTNDWIQVFGVENGYAMIRYAVSAGQSRIGFIDASSLPAGASVDALAFPSVPAVILRETGLTDDPLGEGKPLHTLPAGTQVSRLAVLGDWVYLEWTGAEKPVRGFVPADAVR